MDSLTTRYFDQPFIRFFIVSAIGAIIDFGILILLQLTLLPPISPAHTFTATSIAFSIALLNNFVLTNIWVFPDSNRYSTSAKLMLFIGISIFGGLIRSLWVTLAYQPIAELIAPVVLRVSMDDTPSMLTMSRYGTLIAQGIGMGFNILWNFFANRAITFKRDDE